MFIVSLRYIRDLDAVEQHLAEHIAYLDRHYQSGHFLASGRKVPRTGGVILARATDRQELEGILAEDPFRVHGVAEYEITEFVPSKTTAELAGLRE